MVLVHRFRVVTMIAVQGFLLGLTDGRRPLQNRALPTARTTRNSDSKHRFIPVAGDPNSSISIFQGAEELTFIIPEAARPPISLRRPTVSYDLESESTVKEYSLQFTGRIDCGPSPCRDTAIHLKVSTPQNPALEQDGQTDAEGRYSLQVAFKDIPDETLDWSLQARHDSWSGETAGRRILNVQTNSSVDSQITLGQ